MSWSVEVHGKPAAVAAELDKHLAHYKCVEPEETIRKNVIDSIKLGLAQFPPSQAVSVTASGSQSTQSGTEGPTYHTNQLSVQMMPLWGFVE